MAEHDYDGCVVFHPDNALVAGILETVPDAWGLVWANPRMPDGVDEAIRYLDHPRFVGVKLHPLLDGYHLDDLIVHPIYEAAIARDVPPPDPLRPSDLHALVHRGGRVRFRGRR